MNEILRLALVLVCCFASAGVAQETPLRAQAIGATDRSGATLAAVAPKKGDPRPDLVLKPGDIVSVNVFGEPSLTGAFPVGPGGEIVFPLLGGIPAAGFTAAAIGSDIKARLEADYIRSTQVSVAIAEESALAPNTVTVIGQVTRPGQVAFEEGATLDLFTAIATAGGLTERANRSRIELKRREGDDLRTQILELESSRVLQLQDKDTLIVHAMPEKELIAEVIETVTVIGEVKAPGQVPMKKEQPLDIITAVAMVGGFTATARPSKVFVRRPSAEGVKTFEVNVSKMQKDNSEPFMLQPNDTVTVPQSVF